MRGLKVMKVLIVDRDELSVNLLKNKLEADGHEVSVQESKNDAMDLLDAESFDVIMVDPAPLTSSQPVILNMRRMMRSYPYIFLMGQDLSKEEAMKSGANDFISKPLDASLLQPKMENADNLIDLVERIGDDSEDFPSAGGVISKSAFNQLFLSALERADRYGEKSFILFISIDNFDDIMKLEGGYGAEYASAKLSQFLVRLRRQSDIIGQTAKYKYSLLMQRPVYETEPVEAANRFADELQKAEDLFSDLATKPKLGVRLVEIPTGEITVYHAIGSDAEEGAE